MHGVTPAQQKLGFNIHAFVFVVTMVLLAAINIWRGPPWWVLWVLLGWGIGLLSHWLFTLGPFAIKSESK